jgi:Flp pilus assembly protein TadG
MTKPTRYATLTAVVRAWSLRQRARDNSGAALVEFALVLPIFALMLFGMVQFGLAFAGWDQLRNSVQNSARALALDDNLCSNLTAPDQCVAAIETSIGTPVGTTGPATAAYYYNPPTESEPSSAFVCASAQVHSFIGHLGVVTFSSVSQFDIEEAPAPSPTSMPNNCPAPLQTITIPTSANCSITALHYHHHSVDLLTCQLYNWLDGYQIWESGSWLNIVSTSPGSGQVSDAYAFADGTTGGGPWSCETIESGLCTQLSTNVSGINNFLDPNATPDDAALRSLG